MSQIDMARLVSMARALEDRGDAPVVQAQTSGKLGALDVVSASAEQARADAELARSVISLVRDTAGMGGAQADLAERSFGELLASGQPLSGRDVAAVVTAAVHSLQMELDADAGRKTLEEFAAAMASAPLNTLDDASLPPDLPRVNARQAAHFVAGHLEAPAENPPRAESPARPAPEMDEARNDLEQFRSRLGGSPHYPDGRPSYEPSSKTFFGIPLESCRAWCQERIDRSTVGKSFWKAVGRAFGLSETPLTPFERAALYMESMRALAVHRDRLADAFRRDASEGSRLMGALTRLACHPAANGGSEGMIRNIDEGLELFRTQYENAKLQGQLEDFFAALGGVCFENRMTMLQEYAMAHPLPGDDERAADLANVINHQPEDDMLNALAKEMAALPPDAGWEDIRSHMVDTMVGRERQRVDDAGAAQVDADGLPVRAKIAEEDIDRLREALNGVMCFE